MSDTRASRSERIKEAAAGMGFDLCGIAAAGPIRHPAFFRRWLADGHAGTMGYLHRHRESREDLRTWLAWARSVIVVAQSYGGGKAKKSKRQEVETSKRRNVRTSNDADLSFSRDPTGSACGERSKRRGGPTLGRGDSESSARREGPRGRVARYAWGEDYHVVLREKLGRLVEWIGGHIDLRAKTRICVDTSAIIERELAAAAGIGWIGKNTLVLNPRLGSFFFLGEIITDLHLAADEPMTDHCGTCTRCLEACPTAAFPQPYAMDARRCISYLTIEHRGAIEPDLAVKMGDWVFGCDVCQTVCPYNDNAYEPSEPRLAGDPKAAEPLLDEILSWDEAAHRNAVSGKATDRARLHMWKRNAHIARVNLEK